MVCRGLKRRVSARCLASSRRLTYVSSSITCPFMDTAMVAFRYPGENDFVPIERVRLGVHDPTGNGTPVWLRFLVDGEDDRDDDHARRRGLVMSLNAGGDSQATLRAQIRMAHHVAFWDSVTPSEALKALGKVVEGGQGRPF